MVSSALHAVEGNTSGSSTLSDIPCLTNLVTNTLTAEQQLMDSDAKHEPWVRLRPA